MKFDPNDAIARVETHLVLLALPFRAYGDIRYYLNVIALEPAAEDGVLVMATNGYIAGLVRDVGGRADAPLLVPIGKEQKAALKKGTHLLVNKDGIAWISDDGGAPIWVAATPCVEGRFPDLRTVVGPIAEYRPGLVGSYNPTIISAIKDAYSHLPKSVGVNFFHHPDRQGQALFTLAHHGFGVVMGMRDVSDRPQQPLHDSVPLHFHANWQGAPDEEAEAVEEATP